MARTKRRKIVKRKLALPPLGIDVQGAALGREERTARLTVRLAPSERRQLQELADHFGTTATNVLTHLIGQAWESIHRKGGK